MKNKLNLIKKRAVEIPIKSYKSKGLIGLRQVDDLIFLSGHGPENQLTGEPLLTGKIDSDLSLKEGYKAAKECAIILLGVLNNYLGNLDRIDYIIKVFGLVNSSENFFRQCEVMDGFSDFMVEALGEKGFHARTVMGTNSLPNGNIPVEIEMIIKVKM